MAKEKMVTVEVTEEMAELLQLHSIRHKLLEDDRQ